MNKRNEKDKQKQREVGEGGVPVTLQIHLLVTLLSCYDLLSHSLLQGQQIPYEYINITLK